MIAQWILILTLTTHDGHAITSIPGFRSEAQCMTAAQTWIAQINKPTTYPLRYGVPRALCVRAG